MAIVTPRFTWGWSVTTSNRDLPFDRGGNKDAVLQLGDYLPAEFATEVARAMNAADTGQTYTCVYSFTTRKFTIDNGATTFALEFSRNTTTNAAGLLGFDDADEASTAAGHESTSAVGAGFSTAHTWAPTDPVVMSTPVTAQADGSTGLLLQRNAVTAVNRADGGQREYIYFSTDKILRIRFSFLSAAEQTNMETLLDWLERGRRVNYQPDATSTNALRLALAEPGQSANTHTFLTSVQADYPELVFVEQLSRT